MAFSTETHTKDKLSAGSKSRSGKGRKATAKPIVIGVGLAAALWATAGIATLHSVMSPPKLEAPRLALSERPADVGKALKRGDRVTSATEAEAARLRIAEAIAATEDVSLLMLPASMALATIDKGDRMLERRARASTDPKARDMLRLALAESVAERNAKAIAGLGPQDKNRILATGTPIQTASINPAALAPGARLSDSTETLASGPVALAYATPPLAREVVSPGPDPREQPFVELLSEPETEDHSALPDEVPLPSARPNAPARITEKPGARSGDKTKSEKPATLLAYAKPERPSLTGSDEERPSLFSSKPKLPGRGVAVYDISAGVVHMPNGERLEAHSGRAHMRDNPKFVNVKNRGPTPPNVYNLRMRESRFHGVEAIRMTPVGDSSMYGRDGFLTHTYLLRKRGDSSGCVVFEDYNRFLNAFKRGQVRTLIVVPRMTELPKYVAMM
ncbi:MULTISPECIES: tlde1 domain-containing protein [Alphaproteobacteria]|uniref:Tlde1 domain-containing protein n=2 Tax=Alphaproteobacteria TaxID=28211 RepID=A0A512HID6_9HYPH|nr:MULTISPECIES: tlde1 domain-containing protein [Alphaproteobacteria]GEO85217.1 hypothetical protein RNA01_21490 [Ciceribacter naphthalenivorans]GLR24449.1 hypothetical protein GCM10007920_42430 [Ciceribacter naphthalenivorans]GLT07305.1 hypothetical protein GCM10007926_42430 [Sphingomonas psychrolutea]